VRRHNETSADNRLAELRAIANSVGAPKRLVDLMPYEPSRVVGVVERVRIDPSDGDIEAGITDGTGELIARWPIRSPAPTLAAIPGRAMLLEGIVIQGEDGRLIMEEPTFETFVLHEDM
jgi:hypothetical protein